MGDNTNILEESAVLMARLDKVAELDLTLKSGQSDGFILADGVEAVDDTVATLHVQQVQLDGVARVDVRVGEEVLATQEERLRILDALLSQRLRVIDPIYWNRERASVGV